jgi:hypothetical protein
MKPWEALKALEEGKEVEWRYPEGTWVRQERLADGHAVYTNREYRLKPREPQVVEFDLDCRDPKLDTIILPTGRMTGYRNPLSGTLGFHGKRWRIVATEAVE